MKKEHFLSRLNVLRKEASASFNYDQVPDEFDQADSIPIECLTHGVFYQKPIRHLYGGKCPECVLETKRQLLVDRKILGVFPQLDRLLTVCFHTVETRLFNS